MLPSSCTSYCRFEKRSNKRFHVWTKPAREMGAKQHMWMTRCCCCSSSAAAQHFSGMMSVSQQTKGYGGCGGAPFSRMNAYPTELLAAETRWTWSGHGSTVNPTASQCSQPLLHCVGPARSAADVSERLTSPARSISPLAAASSRELHVAVCSASSDALRCLLLSLTLSSDIKLYFPPISLFFSFLHPIPLSTSKSQRFCAFSVCRAEWHAIVITSPRAALPVQTWNGSREQAERRSLNREQKLGWMTSWFYFRRRRFEVLDRLQALSFKITVNGNILFTNNKLFSSFRMTGIQSLDPKSEHSITFAWFADFISKATSQRPSIILDLHLSHWRGQHVPHCPLLDDEKTACSELSPQRRKNTKRDRGTERQTANTSFSWQIPENVCARK